MTIWTVLDWILYGLVRYILYLIPLVKAPRVDRTIPNEWWAYNSYADWRSREADGGYPDGEWCRSWLEMAFGELAKLATEQAKPYTDAIKSFLLGVIGYIPSRFASTGSWVNWLEDLTGGFAPFFAASLGAASVWLYDRFPGGIVQGWQSWSDIWENIKASVRSWARSQYDQARVWASDNVHWIWNVGESLRAWRDSVRGWIEHVQNDPRGWVLGLIGPGIDWLLAFALSPVSIVVSWLGPDWPKLQTFGRDCVSFYYDLWSAGWRTLGEFVNDPKGFLMDRLERAIMDRW